SKVVVPELSVATHLRIESGLGAFDTIDLGAGDIGETVPDAVIYTGAGHDTVNLNTDGDDPTVAIVDFGEGTGTGDGLGLGNELNIHRGAIANLAQTG